MKANSNRFNVFVLESGSFVWVGATDTKEGATELLMDQRDNSGVEYGFIAEMDVFENFHRGISVGIRTKDGDLPERTPQYVAQALVELSAELDDLVGEADAKHYIKEAQNALAGN